MRGNSRVWGSICLRGTAAILLGIFILTLFRSVSLAAAEDTEQARKVRIGYIGYDGFIGMTKEGLYEGYGVEYLNEIASYTGWEYEYIFGTWESHMQALKEGRIDFLCHAQRTPEREQEYLFSKYSIGAESSVLYAREDDERYYYNDFEAFDGMRIAVLEDSYQNTEFSEFAQKKGFEFTFVEHKTSADCFRALDQGEVDAVAMGSLALKTGYKVICRFGSDPFYFMTGKGNQELIDELDDALGQITAAGSSFEEELYEKYYKDGAAQRSVNLTREQAAFIEQSEEIQIALLPSRKPFSYLDENGEITGITVDTLDLIAERSGFTFTYTMIPEGEHVIDYLARNPDAFVAGAMVDNPEFRGEFFLVSDALYMDDIALACMNGSEYNMNAKEGSYRLVIPANYVALNDYIKSNYPQFEVIECGATEDCLQMVLDGKADFVAQNVNVLKPYLANPHYEGMAVLPTFFMEEETGIVTTHSREHELVIGIFNRCLETITQKELSQFAVNHTVGNAYQMTWRDVLYKFRYSFFAIFLLVLLIFALMGAFIISRRKSYRRLEEKNIQLGDAVAQANEANQAKSRFLASMSHEIRTPMNAIVGLTELAKNHSEEPVQLLEYLEKIETSSKVLLGIINDVLDMSAIESKKLKIARKPFLLHDILGPIGDVYSTQCRQKGIRFALDAEEIVHDCLVGDSLRLNQVLFNLISNACKFTAEGGKVIVKVQELPAQGEKIYYKFTVTDTGEGMSKEMISRLFRPFEQEAPDTAQRHGGSGLGLSITQNLVNLMGGNITCRSEKGRGTRFTVSLPFVAQEAPAGSESMAAEAQETNESYDFGGQRVLLAEDTQINAEIVRELLGLVHLEVDHAWNGKEAVERFVEEAPGTYLAILMDVQMPVMNGYEAAQEIRSLAREDAGKIPIFAMTANAFTEDVSEALNAGMNGHIAKPVDTQVLYRTLRKAAKERA